jgi:hypothetical protein
MTSRYSGERGKPVRLQLSRKRGFDLQALSQATNGLPAVNVARPSRWGNPFDFRKSDFCWLALSYGCRGDRLGRQAASVLAFREWTSPQAHGKKLVRMERGVRLGNDEKSAQIGPSIIVGPPPRLDAICCELAGKNLACWCKPGEPCHADVLLDLANRPMKGE